MRRLLLTLALTALPGIALADSAVPALPSATSLAGASAYIANGGASDTKSGFDTGVFCLSGGNLTLCNSGVSNAMLANSSLTVAGHAITLGGTATIACADLSNAAASCATDATNAANIASGSLPAGRMPALSGDVTSSVGSVTTAVGNVPAAATINADAIHQDVTPVTGEVDVTSSTTLVPVASCALAAGKTYAVTGYFPISSAAASGAKMGLVASGGLSVTSISRTVTLYNSGIANNVTATALDVTSGGVGATTTIGNATISAALVVNAGGTLNAEGAQNVSGLTATKFLINGFFKCQRVN